jgi:hypothetical protein
VKNQARAAILGVVLALAGCVTTEYESTDSDSNYPLVFFGIKEPKPVVLNSRLERYAKDKGFGTSRERNGEWEFEILAPRAWVEAVKAGFVPTTFDDGSRKPNVAWWKPTPADFEAYRMPYSSFDAAHLYVEKHPKDESRIQVFIQRH